MIRNYNLLLNKTFNYIQTFTFKTVKVAQFFNKYNPFALKLAQRYTDKLVVK